MKSKVIAVLFLLIFSAAAEAQKKVKFNYAAQKTFIPAELGRVYLGMPLRDFAANFDFKKSEVEDRYGRLEVKIPLEKGNVTGLYFKAHGLTEEELANLIRIEKVVVKDEISQYELEVKRLDASKIPAKGFVYELVVTYKNDFDLKSYVLKTYGKPKDVHREGEQGYFYDSQWFKKTADNLTWMIRAFHESAEDKKLVLIGVIAGTEWDVNA